MHNQGQVAVFVTKLQLLVKRPGKHHQSAAHYPYVKDGDSGAHEEREGVALIAARSVEDNGLWYEEPKDVSHNIMQIHAEGRVVSALVGVLSLRFLVPLARWQVYSQFHPVSVNLEVSVAGRVVPA